MKIGLIEIEPKIINTAYMQISQYYKQKGNTVEWWTPLEDSQFDYIYCSSIFDFTDKREVPNRAICGGTGYDISSCLSATIESCDYDYSLYPKCDYSILWFSRGCNNNCGFCVVPQKEGKMHPVKPKALNPKGKYVVVQDNSFFDNPQWRKACEYLQTIDQAVEIQNINARTMTIEKCKALAKLRLYKQAKIAWDNPNQDITPKIKLMCHYISHHKIMCYVLIGYDSTPEQDLYRVETLRNFGIDPFVMPYNRKDYYQKRFTRWVNHKAIFWSVNWANYKKNIKPKMGQLSLL